jgi:uncharacterized protein (TIGR03435 family)
VFIDVHQWPAILILLALSPADSPPSFEVASIKPAAPQAIGRLSVRMSVDAARLQYSNVSLRDLIKVAYRLQDEQVSGPDWLGTTRFDILAKLPAGTARDQVPLMLQTLLAERFGVTLHHETRNLNRYSLSAPGKGSKLRKADSATGTSGETNRSGKRLTGKVTMQDLTDLLARELGSPVVDNTGLEGPFEIALEWTPEVPLAPNSGGDNSPPPPAPGPSLFTAVQDQLGLKLSAGRGPVDILVVDHAEKIPTEN